MNRMFLQGIISNVALDVVLKMFPAGGHLILFDQSEQEQTAQ